MDETFAFVVDMGTESGISDFMSTGVQAVLPVWLLNGQPAPADDDFLQADVAGDVDDVAGDNDGGDSDGGDSLQPDVAVDPAFGKQCTVKPPAVSVGGHFFVVQEVCGDRSALPHIEQR